MKTNDLKSGATVRPPAVAGTFYPRERDELALMVDSFLRVGSQPRVASPKAYILPHAGYVYSGPVAGTGYACLAADREGVTRIVLLGPAHRVPVRGLATVSVDCLATPLGRVKVDRGAIESVADLPQVAVMDLAHAGEHSLEVHLPFLQRVLGEFSVVPFVVGDASAKEVDEVLQRLWGGDETRIIVSSDLSHFHDYATACEIDRATASAIERLEAVAPDQACGAHPIAGLLERARERNMSCRLLDLRNSGDTAGSKDRVVGYGAFAFVDARGGQG